MADGKKGWLLESFKAPNRLWWRAPWLTLRALERGEPGGLVIQGACLAASNLAPKCHKGVSQGEDSPGADSQGEVESSLILLIAGI